MSDARAHAELPQPDDSISLSQTQIHTLSARGYGRSSSGLLVPNALPGERVRVEHRAERSWRRLARVVELVEASPLRSPSNCPLSEHCPGCCFRHLGYDTELAFKRDAAQRSFARRARLEQDPALTRLASLAEAELARGVRPATQVDGYRVRCTARAFRVGAQLCLGMRAFPWGAGPIELSQCRAQDPRCRQLLAALTQMLEPLPVFDEDSGQHGLRWLMLHADSRSTSDSRAVLVFSDESSEKQARSQLHALEQLSLATTHSAPSSQKCLRQDPQLLFGSLLASFWVDAQPSFELMAEPLCWTPVAPVNVHTVMATLFELLPHPSGQQVLELGCGVGTLSVALLRAGAAVYGIDAERRSVRCAQHNAQRLGLGGEFFQGEAERSLRRLVAKGRRFDTVILHAMRAGYGERLMPFVRMLGARHLLMIYPTAASLARDLGGAAGFGLRALRAVDQIPRSSALMLLALLEREG